MNNIEIFNETDYKIGEIEFVNIVIEKTLQIENVSDVEFNVIFVDNTYIKSLNKDYRGIDSITDVISFALEDGEDITLPHRILGDIYISYDKAKEQAIDYGHSLKREICFLTVHGLLHLLGYDHIKKEDEDIMFSRQELILNEANITK